LRDAIRYQGADGIATGSANHNLGCFHEFLVVFTSLSSAEKRKHLRLSESYHIESLRISTLNYGIDHHITVQLASYVSSIFGFIDQIGG
jgi:hypothetical protein